MAVADILTGPVKVYYAPVGETQPSKDSVAYDSPWGGNWVALGYSKKGLTCAYNTEELEVMIEESLAAVKRRRTQESVTLELTLAELTAANVGLAVGSTVTSAAAGSGTVGYEQLDVGDESVPVEKAWGFEGLYLDANGIRFPLRVFLLKGTARLNGPLEFSKADYPGIALQVKGLSDMNQSAGSRLLRFQRVTAAAL